MVAALTHEKKEMLNSKPEMDKIGVEAQALKDRLTFLVDEDTTAFNKVMEANRLSATTDDEKSVKDLAVDVANKYAIEIPMETAEKCFRVIELSNILVEKGNPNSVSDAGVAAEVALAGVSGACMNVLINLPGVEDDDYCGDMRNRVEKIMEKAESLQKIVFEKTMNIINK
jgi:formiminotetrahydrofolate cyclodeaminase